MGRGQGRGDFKTGEFYVQAIRLQATKAEYEVLLLQFMGGVIVTLEEAQDGHVTQGVGGGGKMVRDRKMLPIIEYKAQKLHKMVPQSALSLTDAEEATSEGTDTVDQVGDGTPIGYERFALGLGWRWGGGVGAEYLEQSLFHGYTSTIPHLFLHYIDDCIGAASCSHEKLEQFINFTNTFHPNLKFTWTIS
eukprot:g48092.t1